jgi:hypothetical protein
MKNLIKKFFHDLATPINNIGLFFEFMDQKADPILFQSYERLLGLFYCYRILLLNEPVEEIEFLKVVKHISPFIHVAIDKDFSNYKVALGMIMLSLEGYHKKECHVNLNLSSNEIIVHGKGFKLRKLYQDYFTNQTTSCGIVGLIDNLEEECQKINYHLEYINKKEEFLLKATPILL